MHDAHGPYRAVTPGNPGRIRRLQDLTRVGVRFVNRQEGSGTRMLIDLMLRDALIAPERIDGYEVTDNVQRFRRVEGLAIENWIRAD